MTGRWQKLLRAGGARVSSRRAAADAADTANGAWRWREDTDEGAVPGTVIETTLAVGSRVDRFGYHWGSRLFDAGTRVAQRSLPPEIFLAPYTRYVVIKALPVTAGLVAADVGQPGGSFQYLPGYSVRWLLENGFLAQLP
jgi:filamentous hemagglutinin